MEDQTTREQYNQYVEKSQKYGVLWVSYEDWLKNTGYEDDEK